MSRRWAVFAGISCLTCGLPTWTGVAADAFDMSYTLYPVAARVRRSILVEHLVVAGGGVGTVSGGFGRPIAVQLGGFYSLSLRTLRLLLTRPVPVGEFVEQAWFLAAVAFVPTLMVATPFCAIIVFQFNQLLIEFGATDLSGAGAGLAVVREIGPVVTALVVAGAGATAICADLGARTIREEIDAIRVMGIDPIARLVAPRVLASALVALALNGLVTLVGLGGSFVFSVLVQRASPGLFVANLTLVTTLADFVVSEVKATVFGTIAGLVGCYLGLGVKGGPKGVGDAVNQAVVFSFVLLFVAHMTITAVFLQFRY